MDMKKEKDMSLSRKHAIITVVAALVLTIFVGLKLNMGRDPYILMDCIIGIVVMVFSGLLFVFSCRQEKDFEKKKTLFAALVLNTFLTTMCSVISSAANGIPTMIGFLYGLAIFSYGLILLYFLVFWLYVREYFDLHKARKMTIFIIVMILIEIVLLVVNSFTGILFTITEDGYFIYNNCEYISTLMAFVMNVVFIVFIIRQEHEAKEKWSMVSFVAFQIFGLVINLIWAIEKIPYYIPSLICVCYVLPLYLMFFNVYNEREKQLMKNEKELSTARTNLMLSQIQPHFIYNSLTAIIGLIDVDKEDAKESIVSFADYLRTNLDALKTVKLIPFEKELEHIKTYLHFEQLRFDNIKVEYDIKTVDFYVPVLTTQPIVENAIKHGLSVKNEGGTLRISTENMSDFVRITVKDDGVGFDVEEVKRQGGVHIGILNVRKRLADMCGGTLEIVSKKGEGTTAYIDIPIAGGGRFK